MLSKALLISALLSAAQAIAEPAPYQPQRGSISLNTAFGLLKRQSGYQPGQTFCGFGDTCAEACGADYVQCPSSDGDLHCFEPSIQETCCPDGTGNSCSEGYYCTSDATGGTWCCPDGMDLAACAAAYSLTGVLMSETPPSTIATVPVSTSPASVFASLSSTSPTTTFSYTTPVTSSSVQEVISSTAKVTSTSVSNKTSSAVVQSKTTSNVTSATTSAPLQFTAAAGAGGKVVPGLMVLAGALVAL